MKFILTPPLGYCQEYCQFINFFRDQPMNGMLMLEGYTTDYRGKCYS